jgi:hypothetical protein
MSALANKVGNHAVLLHLLDIFNSQRRQFGSSQAAAQADMDTDRAEMGIGGGWPV